MELNSFYSPFTNDNDEMLNISEISFNELKQLKTKEIEEGFQIEYKREYNSTVKNKIPKIITSFANEHGGWLFFGIDEESKEINLLPKDNYEIQINQILKSNTSPFPQCYIRFLHPDSNNQEGIIAIWTPEGQNPPYIAKGKIYRRGGSGSDPIREIEDRYYIDRLYQKSQEYQNKIKDFCKKEISINNQFWNSAIKNLEDKGMLNLYFIPAFGDNSLKEYSGKEIAEYIVQISKQPNNYSMDDFSIGLNIPFEKYSFSPDSIIFRNTKLLDAYNKTLGLEFFYNLSAKFHFPIGYIDDKTSLIGKISPFLENLQDEEILYQFEFINGFKFITAIFGSIGLYTHILKHYNEKNQEIMIIIEIENASRNVLFFDISSYYSFLQKNGLIFSDKSDYFIPFNYQYEKLEVGNLFDILSLILPVCNAFGLESKEAIKFFLQEFYEKAKKNKE